MCMTIREVPATKKAGLCVPCKKVLTKIPFGYMTPFMHSDIPKDGLLVKTGKVPQNYYGKTVGDGCIHSYLSNIHSNTIRRQSYMDENDKIFKAYAIGVIAYGSFGFGSDTNNIISYAVYIPDLDESSNKKERIHACENPTKQNLLKVFPKLGRFKNVFGS